MMGHKKMSYTQSILLPGKRRNGWWLYRVLLDSGLALCGVLLVTSLIALFQLYPRISTISLSYLLVVLALAVLRGRTAAILASVLAFGAFNFFLVPPLYTFEVSRLDDLLSLFVFLATAIITGQLASALRTRAEEAREREQETQVLYELGRAVTNEDEFAAQLSTVVRAVVNVFSVWGVRGCTLLLPDADGTLRVQAQAGWEATPECKLALCSEEEQTAAAWVMQHHQTVDVHDSPLATRRAGRPTHRVVVRALKEQVTQFVRLIPLL